MAIAPGWVSLFAVINGKLWQCGLNGGAAEAWFEIPKPPTDFATILGVISLPIAGTASRLSAGHLRFPSGCDRQCLDCVLERCGPPLQSREFLAVDKVAAAAEFRFHVAPLQYGALCPPQSQKAYVFLVGVDAKVYMAFGDLTSLVSGSSGAGDWQWKSLGAFVSHVTNSPVITYPIGTAQNGTGQPVVFLQTSPEIGADELYSCTWTWSAGLWADLGAPPN